MEGETSVERSTSPPEDLLKELAANETSLIALIKTLLSPKTMPHLFMIVLMSTALYFVANSNNGEDIAALGFISLSLGYAITAIFSANEKVRSWITVTGNVDVSQFNMFQKVKASLKICAFPLAVAIAIGILIMILFSQDSATDLPAVFPISLASLFVIWAIAQGRSFSSWASSLSAKNLPDKQATTGNIVTLAVFQYTVILTLSLIGLIGFEFLYEKEWDITNAIVSNVVFLVIASAAFGLTAFWTREARRTAMHDKALKKFTRRWTLFAHIFATWHLLTVWRQLVMSQQTIEIFIEEVLLMMFTVFMAIWTLTSKSIGPKFKLLSTENALPWGLAFGYAYAGSVAMLATALDDITYVMVIGHIIAFLTITWMQRSILNKVLSQHDVEVDVQRRIDEHASKTAVLNKKEVEVKPASEEQNDEVWQEDEDVQWSGEVGNTIGEDVEWNKVIELED
ncbi:MAG: hypothetical protein HN439_05625 [Euryarchaeota archaeon]|jgi:hypothetical protein|nr:hypothetical protein [Euryarchaeota archaeon]MBT7960405.1 hypothetical protein [Euryarchaeota archaeon]